MNVPRFEVNLFFLRPLTFSEREENPLASEVTRYCPEKRKSR